jgi:hypothetical protein
MERQDYNVHSKLAEAKVLRKRVDEDSRLLANRIALLKQEEAKALKKIEETKKKTLEIIDNRTKIHKEEAKFDSIKKKKEEDYLNKIENLKHEREKMRNMKVQSNKYKFEQAMQEISALKVIKKTNLRMIEIKRFEDLSEKLTKKNKVKEQYKVVEEKKRKLLEDRMEKYKLENLKKAEMENMIRRQKEENLCRLEKLEMDLIQRLQNTQLLQRNAYEDLETALSGQLQ